MRYVWNWLATPGPAWRVGLLRLVSATWLLLHFLPRLTESLPDQVGLPSEWFVLPGLLGEWIPPPSRVDPSLLAPGVGVLALLGGLTCLGIGVRVAGVLFALGMGLLAAWQMGFGFFDHELVLLVEVLLVVVLAPGGDALGVKGVLNKSRGLVASTDNSGLPGGGGDVPAWGERLVLLLLLSVYLAAGIAKLRWGGCSWFSGQTLAFYFSGVAGDFGRQLLFSSAWEAESAWRDGIGLTDFTYRSIGSELSRSIAARPTILQWMAFGGTVLETSAPVALYSIPLRNVYLVVMAAFHLMNGILMGLPFYGYQLLCVSLLVWRGTAGLSTGANDPVHGGVPGASLSSSDHGGSG